ncbi:SH3 domain-containing protein [Bradyrhizobium sp. SRL28]|uniref:SH3 domain-containing protein n=1 Tax=Bradyrhizobium sp. SRL28 TaxID=2836178 RepID=UPI001BDE67D8|nr:SH3 domain-containing protein [Bradyrhizobium sp. SRL28]MBT1509439.1 SH3 domain-containing protein [Bradyrhizobium sp. SRL28]
MLSTVAASAYEITCAAPRVALGDDPADNNPVVRVDVKFIPEEHSWRVFHYRQDGLVVSRSEQYAIQDASTDNKAQWQGSLNRARHLYMVGEVKRIDGAMVYLEWLYDRKKNNQLVMHAAARCANKTTQASVESTMWFQVPPYASNGILNVRRGPGVNHGLVGVIPAGQVVSASRCVPRDDGTVGADWCLVTWNGITGWASQAVLLPLQQESAPAPRIPRPTS